MMVNTHRAIILTAVEESEMAFPYVFLVWLFGLKHRTVSIVYDGERASREWDRAEGCPLYIIKVLASLGCHIPSKFKSTVTMVHSRLVRRSNNHSRPHVFTVVL